MAGLKAHVDMFMYVHVDIYTVIYILDLSF